ncbi:MAG: hypothetical protein IH984_01900 [Planctomycetes bacterium]|nr:hypothetical protein [Planctomycetota bacterium]
MTAEVAILNRQAVAMAADSAVTISFESEGRKREKIFTSANKVFALSKHHPVGIMVYGTASFMEMPWETVIKDYRATLGQKSFDALPDYAEGFLEYLRSTKMLASKKEEDSHAINYIKSYYDLVAKEIEEVAKQFRNHKKASLTKTEIAKLVDGVIDQHYKLWKSAQDVIGIEKNAAQKLKQRIKSIISKCQTEVFEKIPLTPKAKQQLNRLGAWILLRSVQQMSHSKNSGVVLCGFGKKDMYPRLRAFDVNGRVAGVLHASLNTKCDIGKDTEAAIVPFAQQEVVRNFLEGVDPSYQMAIESDFATILSELPLFILNEVNGLSVKERKRVEQIAQKRMQAQFKKYVKNLQQYRRRHHTDPIINMVLAQPKDELADMAEAFVNLTSLRRRVSLDSETVAGPIDVAVISKGDGLIWIKRKHYFKPELNQHFFATYYGRPHDKK